MSLRLVLLSFLSVNLWLTLNAADVYYVDPTKGADKGRRFYGIGGLSGGGVSIVLHRKPCICVNF